MRTLTLVSLSIILLTALTGAQKSDRPIRDPYRKPDSPGVRRSRGSIHHSAVSQSTEVKEPNVNNQLDQLEHRTAVIQGTKNQSRVAPAHSVVKPKLANSTATNKPIDFSQHSPKAGTVNESRSGPSKKIPTRPPQ